MSYGGVVQHVDLSTGKSWREQVDQGALLAYLGGRGVGTRLLWDNLEMGADPWGERNVAIFSPGALSGTSAPCSGRLTMQAKSPATGLYLRSSAGGDFAAGLKFAGYDHLVIHGRADSPVYLLLTPERVEIRPASHLWGKDVRQTYSQVGREVGDSRHASIACIGPAGENGVVFASVMCTVYNALARAGTGAVLGSKKLKAIAVLGDSPVQVADAQRFAAALQQARAEMRHVKGGNLWRYGTASGVSTLSSMGLLPSFNFQRGKVDNPETIDGRHLVEAGYLQGRAACFSCPIGCHRFTEVTNGDHKGSYSGGPEYETVDALAAGCGVTDTEVLLRANELCNIYGMDSISAGGVIQWYLECAQRGVVPPVVDGLDLSWGDGDTLLELLRRIARREGVGELLARGVRQAAQEVGQDSWKWAVEARGLELSRVDLRGSKGNALAFATNPRGPDHLHSAPIAELGLKPDHLRLVEMITGDERFADPTLLEKRSELVRWHEDWRAVGDSLGMCFFATTSNLFVSPHLQKEFFCAATGVEVDEDAMAEAGRRVVTLERCFNVREGAAREDDTLPWRMMNEESPDLPGHVITQEELDGLLVGHYQAHGWDEATGWPTARCLRALGLDDVAKELARLDRSP